MTETTATIHEALDDHDVTLALTPGQVILALIGLFVVLRVIRGLRG